MNFLITLEELKARMGINPDLSSSDEALYSGMIASHLRVQAEMETLFDEGTSTDVFLLDPTYNGVVPDRMFRLKLRNGFLSAAPTITTGPALTTIPQDQLAVDSASTMVDLQRGLVKVDQQYSGQYVTVSYQYGFAEGADVPVWLKEALIGYVPLLLNFSSITNNNAEAETNQSLNIQHVMSVLAPYRRNIGLTMRPL
jgi:hypothetical protein